MTVHCHRLVENAIAGAASAPKYFHLAQAYILANNKEAARQNLAKAHAAGLTPEVLHPLEAGAYQQVMSALKVP